MKPIVFLIFVSCCLSGLVWFLFLSEMYLSLVFLVLLFLLIFVVLIMTPSWSVFLMGLRPIKTISRESQTIRKLSNRYGITSCKLFLAPLYPGKIFLMRPILGSPYLILGNRLIEEMNEEELELLIENLIFQLKTEAVYIRTISLGLALITSLPILIIYYLIEFQNFFKKELDLILRFTIYPWRYFSETILFKYQFDKAVFLNIPKISRSQNREGNKIGPIGDLFSLCELRK